MWEIDCTHTYVKKWDLKTPPILTSLKKKHKRQSQTGRKWH